MYVYGVVMQAIEAATIDRYKTLTAREVHSVGKRRDHSPAARGRFDEDLVHRNILRELGDDAQPMHIVHADILPLYILAVDQESADLIAEGIPDGEYVTGGKPGTIEGAGEVHHAGCGFRYHGMKQLVILIVGVEECMGSVDPDTEMVLRYPIFSVPGEPAAVDPMPGIGMDPDIDGGIGGTEHREFGHGRAGEVFGEVRQAETITMFYHDRGHLPMKD